MVTNEILASDLIKDLAKGRYTATNVREIFTAVYKQGYMEGLNDKDKRIVESMVYLVAQELCYYHDFDKKKLDKVFNTGLQDRLDGIYAGAYDVTDVVRALKEDCDWQWNVVWRDDEHKPAND